MEKIHITTEYINLMQLIKLAGIVGNGSDVKIMVDQGMIKVNGELETRYRRKLYHGDIVEIDENEKLVVMNENQ